MHRPEGPSAEPTPTRASGQWRPLLIPALFGLSGVPALLYQVAWQRILAIQSGVGAFSVTVIVAAYMVGLGIGGQLGGRISRRCSSLNSLRLFALVELAIGGFAYFSAGFYHKPPAFALSWFQGTSWTVTLAHLLALLVPTTLMGMTFPLLVRALVVNASGSSQLIGRLYGLNLLGAALGALLAPWCLIPWVGIEGAIRFGTACNWLTALGVLALWRPPAVESTSGEGSNVGERSGGGRRLLLWTVLYFLSGFTALALEVIWFRMVDIGAKATAFTFGTVLAVYLLGLALGCFAGVRWSERIQRPLSCFLLCQCLILIYAGLTTCLLVTLPRDFWGFDWFVSYWSAYEPISVDSQQPGAILYLYGLFPFALFGLPTVLMGVSFAALQKGVQDEARSSGFKVGVLQSANIAGCVLGALAVGLWWFETPGTAATLRYLVASGGLFATAYLVVERRQVVGRWLAVGSLGLLLLLAWAMPEDQLLWLRLHGRSRGDDTLLAEDLTGVSALIKEGDRWRMSFNGKGQSYLPFGGVHSKLGALPATLHRGPRSVAIIGLGSGDTAWAAACREESTLVRVFEVGASQWPLLQTLAAKAPLERLKALLEDKRVEVVNADGRTELERSPQRYDLIEADAIRPNGAYSGNLYSLEFFQLCASKLEPGGLMCTWSPTPRTRSTFIASFPHVVMVDGGVVLIGSNEPIALDPKEWESRIGSPAVARYLGSDVVAECLGALKSARRIQADPDRQKGINRDLFPRDEYLVPQR